jgi:putative Mg2+ transporter-C (MgtC) family protein
VSLSPEDFIKILLAVLAGGLIGLEREFRDKAAGFRTIIFICLGATLFTIYSVQLAGDRDPTRIAASIVTGVGFLGAGVILRNGGRIMGLTTAATIWLTAAIGMGLGGGQYLLTGISVLLILVILWVFPSIEHRIDNIREERTYQIRGSLSPGKFTELEHIIVESGLKIHSRRQTKSEAEMICIWQVSGSPSGHERLTEALLVIVPNLVSRV